MDRERRLAERNQDVAAQNRLRRLRGDTEFQVGDTVLVTGGIFQEFWGRVGQVVAIETLAEYLEHVTGHSIGPALRVGCTETIIRVAFEEYLSALGLLMRPQDLVLWEGE